MQFEFKVSGDDLEDKHSLQVYAHANDMYSAIFDALQLIRHRLKHEPNVSEAEEKFLDNLRDTLKIICLELY